MDDLFLISQADVATIDTERRRVVDMLSALLNRDYIFEVGSTAVDGVIGKNDLDYFIRVPGEEFFQVREILDSRFERNSNQISTDEYQGYIVESELDVAIQLTISGELHDDFLDFLDLLTGSSDLRERYNELKRNYHGKPMDEYRDAKREFIETALRSKSRDGASTNDA